MLCARLGTEAVKTTIPNRPSLVKLIWEFANAQALGRSIWEFGRTQALARFGNLRAGRHSLER